jgi:hypothetical protein
MSVMLMPINFSWTSKYAANHRGSITISPVDGGLGASVTEPHQAVSRAAMFALRLEALETLAGGEAMRQNQSAGERGTPNIIQRTPPHLSARFLLAQTNASSGIRHAVSASGHRAGLGAKGAPLLYI